MKRKSVALLFLGFVAMFLGIFGAKGSVSATSDITISFDFNTERIENYLPQSFFVGLNNFSQNYSYGEEVTFPSIPQTICTYYTYDWTCDGTKVDTENYTATENRTFKLQWKPIEYTIYYNYLTNEEKAEITNFKATDTYSVEKQVHFYQPKRPHYYFIDWYKSFDFKESEIDIYTDKYAQGDRCIYAKWMPVEYTINYHTDAKNFDNPTSYNVESPTYELQTPIKEGHIFKGWFYDQEYKNQAYKINKGDFGNLDLYPLWELKTYNVTYILPDGEKEVVTVEYGKNAEKPSVKSGIFQILSYSASTSNITDDTEISVKYVNIWYVYVIGLIVIAGIVLAIVFAVKNRNKKLHKLRQIYQSNVKSTKRKIR